MKHEEIEYVYIVYSNEGNTFSHDHIETVFRKEEDAKKYVDEMKPTFVMYSIKKEELR